MALAVITGVLTGVITDTHRHPVASAKVHLQDLHGKELATAVTDSTGKYRFTPLPGTYLLRAEDAALDEGKSEASSVTEGRTTTVNLLLQPQYFDKPQFTVAGVTDNTYRGGHGSDTVLRSAESLNKATAALAKPDPDDPRHPLDTARKLQAAAEANPSEPNLFNWGTELLAHQAPQPAAQVYRQGVRQFPNSTRLLLGLASAHYAAGDYEQAADCFFKAVDSDPNNSLPYQFLSQVRRAEINHLPGYQERLARFAALRPENALANYWYALTVTDAEKKRTLLERAVALDSNLADAHLQLGILDAAGRNYQQSIQEYSTAIRIQPDLEEAHYRLSEAYRLTGDSAQAQRERDIYHQLSKLSEEKLEQERRELRQFVIALKAQ